MPMSPSARCSPTGATRLSGSSGLSAGRAREGAGSLTPLELNPLSSARGQREAADLPALAGEVQGQANTGVFELVRDGRLERSDRKIAGVEHQRLFFQSHHVGAGQLGAEILAGKLAQSIGGRMERRHCLEYRLVESSADELDAPWTSTLGRTEAEANVEVGQAELGGADRLQCEGAAAVLESELAVEENDAAHLAQLGIAIGAHRVLQPLGRQYRRTRAAYGVRSGRRFLRSRLEPVGQVHVGHSLDQLGGPGGAQIAETGHRDVLGG